MSYSYRDIIKLRFPNKKVQKFTDSTYSGIIWNSLDTTPNPTKEELDSAIFNEDIISNITGSNLVNAVKIPALSSNNIIPLDNSTPLITEGTKILEIDLLPINGSSKLIINGSLLVSCSVSKRNLTVALFKDSICIGCIYKYIPLLDKAENLSFTFIDDTLGQNYNGNNPKYSIRMGIDSQSTWYVNRTNQILLNNTLINNGVVFLTC